jgi:hypothetical protein
VAVAKIKKRIALFISRRRIGRIRFGHDQSPAVGQPVGSKPTLINCGFRDGEGHESAIERIWKESEHGGLGRAIQRFGLSENRRQVHLQILDRFVTLASNEFTYTLDADGNLAKRQPYAPFVNVVLPLLVSARNGKLLVDADVSNRFHNARIIDSVPQGEMPRGWDTNRDDDAMEIVDDKKRPVFQLFYESPSTAVLNGIFVNDAGQFTISLGMAGFGMRQEDVESALNNFHRLFVYPSKDNPGVRTIR